MLHNNGYPETARPPEYLGSGDRYALTTARLAGEAAGLGLRTAEAQAHAFNWGPSGVGKLIEDIAASDGGSSVIRAGTKRVVGNLSPNSRPLASNNLSTFAPEGSPRLIDELRAVVLHGDKAVAVVTRRTGDKFSVGLVELGVGSNNPGYEGVKGKCVARVDGLEIDDNNSYPYTPPETHTVEKDGIRVLFESGQVMVEPYGDKADGISVLDSFYPREVQGAKEFTELLKENTLMWSIDSTNHDKILGVRY